MFTGHFAAALVAKRVESSLPLWALLLGAQIVDVFWALFVLMGIEQATLDPTLPGNPLVLSFMPYTHSALATLAWMGTAAALAAACWGLPGRRSKVAAALALVVGSHWLFDWVVHRPDLLLVHDHKVGLALWNQPWLAYTLEVALVAGAALWLWRAGLVARPRVLLGLSAALIAVQTVQQWGPVPASLTQLTLGALLCYALVVGTGVWIEHHRHSPD